MSQHRYCVVGAGIVGLTTAYEILSRAPSTRVAVVEKEDAPGRHASGRNSGVLHCGLYYGSDTRKAQVCAVGGRAMKDFADAHGIQFLVRDLTSLDKHSRKLLDRFL